MADQNEITPVGEDSGKNTKKKSNKALYIWLFVGACIILLALLAAAIYFLFSAPAAVTTQIRDIFIIFMALEFMLLGVALIIFIVQLAKMVNLLQNEVKPILEATNETINTLKGTTEFLSENLVEPVIKLNGYVAGLKKILDLLKIFRN